MTTWNEEAQKFLDEALKNMRSFAYFEGYTLYRKAVLMAAESEGFDVPDESNETMAAALQFLGKKLPAQTAQIQEGARTMLVEVDSVFDDEDEWFRHLFCLDGHSPEVPALMEFAPLLVQWVERLQAGEEWEPPIEDSEPSDLPDDFCMHGSPYVSGTGRYECGKC